MRLNAPNNSSSLTKRKSNRILNVIEHRNRNQIEKQRKKQLRLLFLFLKKREMGVYVAAIRKRSVDKISALI